MEGFRGTDARQGRTKVLHRRAEWTLLATEATGARVTLRTGVPAEDMG
jgi:hypothetical protein